MPPNAPREPTATLPQPTYGETVHRRLGAVIVGIDGTRTRVVPRPGTSRLLGGRRAPADIVLDDPSVSASHFELELGEQTIRLRDLGSKNGTWIFGERRRMRTTETLLLPGDRFGAGNVTLELEGTEDVDVAAAVCTSYGELLGSCPAMQELYAMLARLAPSPLDLLVFGETGTGKELVARALHDNSHRASGPLVVLDCSSVPRGLAEAVIHGQAAGAFTGAVSRGGCFEDAHGGTLLLDEIGELPLELQIKLLRVLDRREVQRIGEARVRPVDVRVIAASKRDLQQMVVARTFRDDLFYRIAQHTIELPPLRARGGDIAELARAFLAASSAGHESPLELAPAAEQRLREHAWPGNVRELRNVCARAAQMCTGPVVLREDLRLGAHKAAALGSGATALGDPPLNFEDARRVFERGYLSELLAHAEHNVSLAARIANVSRRGLYDMLARLGISAR